MSAMDLPAAPALRWARAMLLAAVCMISGAVAHVSAGGLLPGFTALLVLFGLWLGVVASLLARPASTLRIVVLLIAGQTFIHGAMTALAGHKGDPLPGGPSLDAPGVELGKLQLTVHADRGRRVGSLQDQLYPGQHDTALALTVPLPVQHLVADMTGPHALMALAHIAAAAAVGLWLAMGERALWTVIVLTVGGTGDVVRHIVAVCDALVGGLSGLVATVRLPPWARVLVERSCLPPLGRGLSRIVVRRGPPALLTP